MCDPSLSCLYWVRSTSDVTRAIERLWFQRNVTHGICQSEPLSGSIANNCQPALALCGSNRKNELQEICSSSGQSRVDLTWNHAQIPLQSVSRRLAPSQTQLARKRWLSNTSYFALARQDRIPSETISIVCSRLLSSGFVLGNSSCSVYKLCS
jgi:hypothetical protein